MFILCKGELAKEPYIIPLSETPVYSLEELCFYMYHHIYSVTEEFFDEKLAVWLGEQAGLEELAEKMRVLVRDKKDLKDLVVTLMCSCDYYKEGEILQLVTVMKKIENLPAHKKNKIKADHYLRAGKYGKSLQEYKQLLYGEMAEQFSTEEYGNLLHNQAIALFHVSSFQEAANGFKEAYARNRNEQSLQQYLYALLLDGQEEKFEQEGSSFGKTEEELRQLRQNYIEAQTGGKDNGGEEEFINRCKNELRSAYSDGGVNDGIAMVSQ